MKSNLSILCLESFIDVISKNSFPNPRLQRFIPMPSSKSFIALTLTFRSLIDFELIFAYDMN